MRRIFITFFLFLFASTSYAKGPLTLQEAWEMLLTYDPQLKASEQKVYESKGEKMAVRSIFFPRLEGNVSIRHYAREMGFISPPIPEVGITEPIDFIMTDQTVPRYAITMDQLIFDSGRSMALYKGAKKGVQASEHEYFARQQKRAIDLVQVFSDYYLATKYLNVARSVASAWEEQERAAKQLYQQQMATHSDVLTAEVEADNARLRVTKAEDTLKVAAKRLAALIGEKPGEVASPKVPPPPQEVPSPANRPEIKAKSAQIEMERMNARAEGLAYLPKIVGQGEAFYVDDSFVLNKEQARLVGALHIPVFDGKKHWGQRKAAQARELKHRWEKKAMEDAMEVETDNILRNWHRSEKEIQVAFQNRQKTKENLRITRAKFKEGFATTSDVKQAMMLWAQSEFQYHRSLCLKEITAAKLREASGVPVLLSSKEEAL